MKFASLAAGVVLATAWSYDVLANEQLFGVWKFVGHTVQALDTKETKQGFGLKPSGYKLLTPQGLMLVIRRSEDGKTMIAESGRYQVNADKVIIKIDNVARHVGGSWREDILNSERVVTYKLEGNTLIWMFNVSSSAFFPSRAALVTETFQRE